MSFEWNDKRNDVDDVNAEDINSMAHEVLRLGQLANTNSSYPYETVDMADVLAMFIPKVNTVTYVYGKFDMEQNDELHFPLVIHDVESNVSEETVLILDFTAMERVPTVTFTTDGIKWLNGEPPQIEAGKVYMFSFVRVKRTDTTSYFYIAVGGEFA